MIKIYKQPKLLTIMKSIKIIRSIAFLGIAIASFVFSEKIDDMKDGDDVLWAARATSVEKVIYRNNAILKKGIQYAFILVGCGFLAIALTPIIPSERKSDEDDAPEAQQKIEE